MEPEVYAAHARLEAHHWWFVGRRRIVRTVLRRTLAPGSTRTLDVGCGTGGMLPMLAELGPVEALEPEPTAAAHARRQCPQARVAVGRVPEDVPSSATFDLVTAFDVIEHIDDDVAALRALRAATRPGGTVVVTVPALRVLWSEHDVANRHRRRYTKRQLRSALAAADLGVEHLSYFNTLLFPAVLLVRLVGRLLPRRRPPRSDLELEVPGSTINRVLTRVFGAEATVVATVGLPIGVSLVAVARR